LFRFAFADDAVFAQINRHLSALRRTVFGVFDARRIAAQDDDFFRRVVLRVIAEACDSAA
jgi:hypothetical protein